MYSRIINLYNKLISYYASIAADINYGSNSSLLNQESKKKFTLPRILKVKFIIFILAQSSNAYLGEKNLLRIFYQIVARDRTEDCAYALVQFLMKKYGEIDKINYSKSDGTDIEEENLINYEDDVQHESDNTSILVYKLIFNVVFIIITL